MINEIRRSHLNGAMIAMIAVWAAGCMSEDYNPNTRKDIAVIEQPILSGLTLPATGPNSATTFLPIRVNHSGGVCSGVLLTNSLVLTDEHCIPQGSGRTLTSLWMPPTNHEPEQLRTTATLIPHPSNKPSSFGIDTLLIRVSEPFRVNASVEGFRRKIWNGTPSDLVGKTVRLVGAGPALPFESDNFLVDSVQGPLTAPAGGTYSMLWMKPPPFTAYEDEPGDSGGGVFLQEGGEDYLVGNYVGNRSGALSQVFLLDANDVRTYINDEVNAATHSVGCGSKKMYLGDFDGDGQTDLLCHDPVAGTRHLKKARDGSGFDSNWTNFAGNWCTHSGSRLFVGNFDGEDGDDLLCTDSVGDKYVDFSNDDADSAVELTGSNFAHAANWCHTFPLYVGDVDDDGADDLICQDPATGRIWIDLASNNFTGTDGTRAYNNGFCTHPGAKFYVGDFDGNGSDDLLCHDTAGDNYIEFATAGGHFFTGAAGSSWSHNGTFCTSATSKLHVADLDGDPPDDLLCRSTSGALTVDYAFDGLVGTEWSESRSWCTHPGSTFFVPHTLDDNIFRNSAADFFCHDTAGTLYLDYR